MKMIRLRKWLRRFIAIIVFFLGTISLNSITIGSAVMLVGGLFHLWAIGCLVRNTKLTTGGPYRFVRHPFYSANFIIDIGICLCGFNPHFINGYLIIIGYLILYYVIYYSRTKMEERHLIELFGKQYEEYQQKVPRLIPLIFKRFPRDRASEGFTWHMVLASTNEIPRLIRLLTYPMFFYLKSPLFEAIANKTYFKAGEREWLIILCLIIMMQLLALIIKLLSKKAYATPA